MKKRFVYQILSLMLCLGLVVPASAAHTTFEDVSPTHWAYDAVEFVVDQGLFNGTGPTTFSPDTTMTRAMLVQVLYRYAGSPAVSGTVRTETTFTDVPDNAYYANALVWACQNQLLPNWFLYDTSYYNVDSKEQHVLHQFQPEKVMVRLDFAIMLNRFMSTVLNQPLSWDFYDSLEFDAYNCPLVDMRESGINTAFITAYPEYNRSADDTIVAYYALAWAYKMGIMSGTSATTMSPTSDITRAQVAVMLKSFSENYDTEQSPQVPETQPEEPNNPEPVSPTLVNGKEINDDNIREIIYGLQGSYPEGMRWTNDNYYSSDALYRGGYGCEGFGLICSDAVFGDLPLSGEHSDFDEIRVGDLVRINHDTHTVVVLEKHEDSIVVVEGNFNSSIHWGREITYQSLIDGGFSVRTRYP